MLVVTILRPDAVEVEKVVVRDDLDAEMLRRLRNEGAKLVRAEIIRPERIGPRGYRSASAHLRTR